MRRVVDGSVESMRNDKEIEFQVWGDVKAIKLK